MACELCFFYLFLRLFKTLSTHSCGDGDKIKFFSQFNASQIVCRLDLKDALRMIVDNVGDVHIGVELVSNIHVINVSFQVGDHCRLFEIGRDALIKLIVGQLNARLFRAVYPQAMVQ